MSYSDVSKTYKEARERDKSMSKRRSKAAAAVSKAVSEWRLPPAHYLFCSDCKRRATCYDHRNYFRPLDVWPVCSGCDAKRGAGEPYDGADKAWRNRMYATRVMITKKRKAERAYRDLMNAIYK